MSVKGKFIDYSTKINEAVKAGIPGALQIAAVNITSKAKDLVPVDTGNLRNSISYRQGDTPSEMIVGANAPYAIHQEYGTRYMKPQPYMRPAIDLVVTGRETMESIKEIMNNYLLKVKT